MYTHAVVAADLSYFRCLRYIFKLRRRQRRLYHRAEDNRWPGPTRRWENGQQQQTWIKMNNITSHTGTYNIICVCVCVDKKIKNNKYEE